MTRFIMFFLCSVEQTWLFIIERPSSVGEWGLGVWGGGRSCKNAEWPPETPGT